MSKKSLPIGVIVILVLAMLATMSVAYGAWTSTLQVDEEVNLGIFSPEFAGLFTDDDGAVANAGFDGTDDGFDPVNGGINTTRSAYAVGSCASGINEGVAWFQIDNAYPGYICTVFVDFSNPGSIPYTFTKSTTWQSSDAFTVQWVGNSQAGCGDTVAASGAAKGWFIITVGDTAVQGATYTGWYRFNAIQWNKYTASMCQ